MTSKQDARQRPKSRKVTKDTGVGSKQRQSAVQTPSRSFEEITCACKCGERFIPRDSRQRFVPGHRFTSYGSCKCPTCGITHRKGVNSD